MQVACRWHLISRSLGFFSLTVAESMKIVRMVSLEKQETLRWLHPALSSRTVQSQGRWQRPVIPAEDSRLRQEDHEFEASLST